ncbi:unnamed protein product [Sphenostylis stenocarpa]|uniref:Uncharacterized protein n=1 Tax=Sphenostylis stenocarpa TaxID=92480 RepID=A0AA86RZ43_9FABA|nr:unnamed protein product [Sphenostylis stenocarpa]
MCGYYIGGFVAVGKLLPLALVKQEWSSGKTCVEQWYCIGGPNCYNGDLRMCGYYGGGLVVVTKLLLLALVK